jgi:hydroxyethylthiazole kinase-like uncharacterized protein yjeF
MANPIMLLQRSANAHKGSHGSVGIVGGATGTVGAAFLSARTALYAGAGRVFVFRPTLADGLLLDPLTPEVMVSGLDSYREKPITTWVVGPGLGQSLAALGVLKDLLKVDAPLVVDADALTLVATHPTLSDLCNNRTTDTVITPHPGEAARLLGTSVAEVQRDRLGAAESLVRRLRCVVVLKGNQTVVADLTHARRINQTGNPALATAGTGDVLAGFIGALLAQGLAAFDAASLAVEMHGSAADRLVAKVGGMVGVTASELIPEIRKLLNASLAEASGPS